MGWVRAAKAAGTGAVVFLILIVGTLSVELGGSINVLWGGWLALVGAVAAFVGTRPLAIERPPTLALARLAAPWEIAAIAAVMLVLLFGAAYALDREDPGVFVTFVSFAAVAVAVLSRSGVLGWLAEVTRRHRGVLVFSAFAVAFLFPFTQDGSDANMSIATQVLIFAGTAMGLNIVVGLAGLLDLGYIAFLGAGAFVAAILSRSAFSTWEEFNPPFIVTVLISGLVAAVLGLIIGSPTLRVSGDYLAIVTLAFGEIFRLSMINLDGTDGPNLTRGSNGIPAIPDLNLFGFDFGDTHEVLGIPLGRFSNYYFLMLVVIAIIILVFTRLNNSRIGRGWVAIREDEKAAEAMGVNTSSG